MIGLFNLQHWIRCRYVRRHSWRCAVVILMLTGLFYIIWAVYTSHSTNQWQGVPEEQVNQVTLYRNPFIKQVLPTLSSLCDALRHHADDNGVIILTTVDESYIDMALNFYLTSLKKFQIMNYLFLTTDIYSTKILTKKGISAFTLFQDNDGYSDSTTLFNRNTNYKTLATLTALELGLTVIVNDADIVYLKNPFLYLPNCETCDLQMTEEGRVDLYNSGFYVARPTNLSIQLHQEAYRAAFEEKHPTNSHQPILNKFISDKHFFGKLNIQKLNVNKYISGRFLWYKYFCGDLKTQKWIILHNNWLHGFQAKRYRFKEYQMWAVDTNGYYSSTTNKYLVYSNPLDFGEQNLSTEEEKKALKNAFFLGSLLNRIVILPRFHCYSHLTGVKKYRVKECSYIALFDIKKLDKFLDYRESEFFRYSLVPFAVQLSTSPLLQLDWAPLRHEYPYHKNVKLAKTTNISLQAAGSHKNSVNIKDLVKKLASYSHHSVLNFHSLYGNFFTYVPKTYKYQKYTIDESVKERK